MMNFKSITFFVVFLSCLLVSKAEKVEVVVEGATSIAQTDEDFICVTLDWWPTNKCDYDQCPWGQAGLFNLDLKNKILEKAVKAFNPLRIRVGGSLQDQVVYNVRNNVENCQPFQKQDKDFLFGFSIGCLDMKRWDELNEFFNQTRAKVTFGLNALIGRKESEIEKTLWVGDWYSHNARDLMSYTISKGYKIDSYELGNELCGSGVSAKIEAKQYAKDMATLKNLVKEMYPNPKTQPKVLGPGGFYDKKWFDTFLDASGHDVIDGVTHHIYNLGPGNNPDVVHRVQDPFFLTQIAQTFKDVSNAIDKFAPWSGAWVSESGGAYNSGGQLVSYTFAFGFWYLDQLGMTSIYNHKVYCRQALTGGNYALLNTTTFIPNPDYYGALLWHKVMGSKVLSVTHKGSPYLRVYSHCAKKEPGISFVFINLSKNTSFEIDLFHDLNLNGGSPSFEFKGHKEREEYHLTPKDGNILSSAVLLNGTPLELSDSLEIPDLKPKLVDGLKSISIAAHSIAFVTIRDFNAPACS
ncbi:heparanase-like protein 2 [Gossypium raimondii]|nr:heparanase-like protein 2 [Gossypium raimondii]